MTDTQKAVSVLKQGGIVIYPTDTAFGIGCRIDKTDTIRRLFAIRKRPENQAMPILVNSISMAKRYYRSPLPYNVRRIMNDYWPGALTVIYYCRKKLIPSPVRGDGQTIGIRMPDHRVALALIKGCGVPILGSSANYHGNATPHSYKQLDIKLVKEVDYVLKGQCKLKKASTVIDCTSWPWQVVRQGAVRIKLT